MNWFSIARKARHLATLTCALSAIVVCAAESHAQADVLHGRGLKEKEASAYGKESLSDQSTWFQVKIAPAIEGKLVHVDEKEAVFLLADKSYFAAPIDSFYLSDQKRLEKIRDSGNKPESRVSIVASDTPSTEGANVLPIGPIQDWQISKGRFTIKIRARLLAYEDGDFFVWDENTKQVCLLSAELLDEEQRSEALLLLEEYVDEKGPIDAALLLRETRTRYFFIPRTFEMRAYEVLGYVGEDILVRENHGNPVVLENSYFEPGMVFRHLSKLKKRNPDGYDQEEYHFPVDIPEDKRVSKLPELDEANKKMLLEWMKPDRVYWTKTDIPVQQGDSIIDIDRDGDMLLIENQMKFYTMHVSGKPRRKIPESAFGKNLDRTTIPAILLANDNKSVWIVAKESVVHWDLDKGEIVEKLGSWKRVEAAQYSADANHFGVLDDSGMIHFLDLLNKKERILPSALVFKQRALTGFKSFLVSDDGESVVIGFDREAIRYRFPDAEQPPQISKIEMPARANPTILTSEYLVAPAPTIPGFIVSNFTKDSSQTVPGNRLPYESVSVCQTSGRPILQTFHGKNNERLHGPSHMAVIAQDLEGRGSVPTTWIESVSGKPSVYTPDGNIYVIVGPEKSVLVKRPPVKPLVSDDLHKLVRKFLKDDNSAGIEAIAEYLLNNELTPQILSVDGGYSAFVDFLPSAMARYYENDGGDLAERIDLRLQYFKRRHPESPFWKVVLAAHRISCGWIARGNGLANSVTEDGWVELERQLDSAYNVLSEDVSFKDLPSKGFIELLVIGKAQSWDKRKYEKLIEKLIVSRSKDSLSVHMAFLDTLSPKWGGSVEEEFQYLARMKPLIKPERREIFYMLAMLEILSSDENPNLAKRIDWKEFAKGFEKYYEIKDDPRPLEQGYRVAFANGQLELARQLMKIRCDTFVYPGELSGSQMAFELRNEESAAKANKANNSKKKK